MQKPCWETYKQQYSSYQQLRAWAMYQRAYQQWRATNLQGNSLPVEG